MSLFAVKLNFKLIELLVEAERVMSVRVGIKSARARSRGVSSMVKMAEARGPTYKRAAWRLYQ